MKTQLDTEIAGIHHHDLRELTRTVLHAAPSCFWHIPASSSGKYHPQISLGTGGLIRHTRAVYQLTLHLLDMHGIPPSHTHHSIALAAALLHDCCKQNDDETHTAFDHPLRAAELIKRHGSHLSASLVFALADTVAAHMGRWCTSKHTITILPRPQTQLQHILHTADFLASRKNITLQDIR